jgi:hypothetical protein
MDNTFILPRGGCRFIAGDPHDFHERGDAIYCRKPVAHAGAGVVRRA